MDELINDYEEGSSHRDEVFNKIKIHQNLSSIPLEKVEKELFDSKPTNSEDFHHTMTGITGNENAIK